MSREILPSPAKGPDPEAGRGRQRTSGEGCPRGPGEGRLGHSKTVVGQRKHAAIGRGPGNLIGDRPIDQSGPRGWLAGGGRDWWMGAWEDWNVQGWLECMAGVWNEEGVGHCLGSCDGWVDGRGGVRSGRGGLGLYRQGWESRGYLGEGHGERWLGGPGRSHASCVCVISKEGREGGRD